MDSHSGADTGLDFLKERVRFTGRFYAAPVHGLTYVACAVSAVQSLLIRFKFAWNFLVLLDLFARVIALRFIMMLTRIADPYVVRKHVLTEDQTLRFDRVN